MSAMKVGRLDVVAEIEKRKKQIKVEENRIFTCLANQARLDSQNRIQKHKNDHKSPLTVNARSKYMSQLESGSGIVRELEEILQKANLSRSSSADFISKSREQIGLDAVDKNRCINTLKQKHRKRKPSVLPSLQQRYGNITETWVKGPIDVPKDRYFDLNDTRIYGNTRDPRARQLRQQTKCLMNSMQMMSRQAKLNETCRKRAVEASQETGEDHVLESFDQFVSATTNTPGQGKAILNAALSQVVYTARKARRKPNTRIDEAWQCLKVPMASKLWFKLLSDSQVETNSSARDTARSGSDSVAVDCESGTLISRIEHLSDLAHTIDLLHVLLLMWFEREDLPEMFSSNELLQPVANMLRLAGLQRTAKGSSEEMSAWLQSILDSIWELCRGELEYWKTLCMESTDRHFYNFFLELEKTLGDMVHCIPLREAELAAEAAAVAAAEEERLRAEAGREDDGDNFSEVTFALWQGVGVDGEMVEDRRGSSMRHTASGSSLKKGVIDNDESMEDTRSGSGSPMKSRRPMREKPEETVSCAIIEDEEDNADPLAVVSLHPRNARSSKVIRKLQRIEEVLDIGQLLHYHQQKPNKILLGRLSSLRQEESTI